MCNKEKWLKSQKEYEVRNKQLRREQAHEGMRRHRERVKAMTHTEQESVKAQQHASQAKYHQALFMDKYEDDPGKMPDDRVHRRGHKYHPEDYPTELNMTIYMLMSSVTKLRGMAAGCSTHVDMMIDVSCHELGKQYMNICLCPFNNVPRLCSGHVLFSSVELMDHRLQDHQSLISTSMDPEFPESSLQLPPQPWTNQELRDLDSSLTAFLYSDNYDFMGLDFANPTLVYNIAQPQNFNLFPLISNDQCVVQPAEYSNLSLGFSIGSVDTNSSQSELFPMYSASDYDILLGNNLYNQNLSSTVAQDKPSTTDSSDAPAPLSLNSICPPDLTHEATSEFIPYVPPKEKSRSQCSKDKRSSHPATDSQSLHTSQDVHTPSSLTTRCDIPETATMIPAASNIVSGALPVNAGPVIVDSLVTTAATGVEKDNEEHHLQSPDSEARGESVELSCIEDNTEDSRKTWAGCNPTKAKIPVPPRKVRKGQDTEMRKICEDEQRVKRDSMYKKQRAPSLYLAKVSAKAEEVNKNKAIGDRVHLDDIRRMIKDEEDMPEYEGMMKEEESALLDRLLEKRTVKVQGA
ncbi:hypothetical protein EDD18DRAFT_1113867 [Armillaria luteobubalina]|uniref:Uncharacterized protein n=1 Tax=Armillaria luteobubalina TaxID=153913 RepID=A0AA39UEL4_9AGAR|nr:hypothetical protein EDD18DRAFT_1113867 [Armillaria luteobubalina]